MEVSYLVCLNPKGGVDKTGGALDPDMTGAKNPFAIKWLTPCEILWTWHLHVAFLGVISQVMEVTLKKGRVAAWLQGLTPQISLPISVSDFAYHLSFLLLGTGFLRK